MLHYEWAREIGGLQEMQQKLAECRSTVIRLNGQGDTEKIELGERHLYQKRYKPSNFLRCLRDFLIESRAMREWRRNCRAEEAKIHTAHVLAALTEGYGLNQAHYLLTEAAPGKEMKDLLTTTKPESPERERLLGTVAHFLHQIHEKRFWHAHFNCQHVFLTEAGAITLIDLENASIGYELSWMKRWRNVEQMQRSLRRFGTEEDAAFFARAYREVAE